MNDLLDHNEHLAHVDGLPGSLQALAVLTDTAGGVISGASNSLTHAGPPD